MKLNKVLLIFLALLQFVAPLVHAHSGHHFSQFGWHLPTLEVYSATRVQKSFALQANNDLADLHGAIVSISTGIENFQNDADDLPLFLYFSPHPFFITPVLVSYKINFSPQSSLALKEFLHPLQAPRAPPV